MPGYRKAYVFCSGCETECLDGELEFSWRKQEQVKTNCGHESKYHISKSEVDVVFPVTQIKNKFFGDISSNSSEFLLNFIWNIFIIHFKYFPHTYNDLFSIFVFNLLRKTYTLLARLLKGKRNFSWYIHQLLYIQV